MDTIYIVAIGYFIIINIIAIVVMAVDKTRAIKHQWRIPENMLFLICTIGGSFGSVFSMFYFHHKNRKPKFRIGFPLIMIIHIAVIILIVRQEI